MGISQKLLNLFKVELRERRGILDYTGHFDENPILGKWERESVTSFEKIQVLTMACANLCVTSTQL